MVGEVLSDLHYYISPITYLMLSTCLNLIKLMQTASDNQTICPMNYNEIKDSIMELILKSFCFD